MATARTRKVNQSPASKITVILRFAQDDGLPQIAPIVILSEAKNLATLEILRFAQDDGLPQIAPIVILSEAKDDGLPQIAPIVILSEAKDDGRRYTLSVCSRRSCP